MKLKLKGSVKQGLYTTIIDEEGDEIKIDFNYDDAAYIITTEYSYICLSSDILYQLAALVEEAEQKYLKEL